MTLSTSKIIAYKFMVFVLGVECFTVCQLSNDTFKSFFFFTVEFFIIFFERVRPKEFGTFSYLTHQKGYLHLKMFYLFFLPTPS